VCGFTGDMIARTYCLYHAWNRSLKISRAIAFCPLAESWKDLFGDRIAGLPVEMSEVGVDRLALQRSHHVVQALEFSVECLSVVVRVVLEEIAHLHADEIHAVLSQAACPAVDFGVLVSLNESAIYFAG
jgi:hypothetical protein